MGEHRTQGDEQNQNQSQNSTGAQKHYSKDEIDPARQGQSNDSGQPTARGGAGGSATRDGAFESADDVESAPGVQRDRHQRPR